VRFHGHVEYGPKLFEFYHQADMFVLPSTGAEGTPRVVTEAMSQSVPVIVTKVGGNPGTVMNGDCGVLIEPGDADAIADSIEKLIDDGEFRRNLIRKGFERVKGFTMDHHSKDLFEKLSNAFPELFNHKTAL
jgi:glycosyltransferase involved in cell wall biosynthesis